MKIEEFINGYKNATKKEDYVKKHITNNYVPYSTKVAQCKKLVDVTSYVNINDKKMYYVNSPAQALLYNLLMVDLYTDIDLSYSEEEFDMLDSDGLIDVILANISTNELTRFTEVLAMTKQDLIENERDFVSFIDKKIDALNLMADGLDG